MPDTETWLIVAVASLVLVVIPGPAVIYILTRSVSQGRAAGLASAVGVNLGSAIHVVAAVAGLSVILTSSAILYSTVKWAGVAYLVWLGIRTLQSQDEILADPSAEPAALRRIFTQGVIVNVLNPKVAMFFLAFLPQFVDPNGVTPWLQSFILGLTLVFIGLISDSVYALIGGQVGGVLRRNPRAGAITRTASGVTYIALAGVAAVTGSRS